MRTCSKCSAAAPDDARFCPACAAPLDAATSADWAATALFADQSLGATTARPASLDVTRAPAPPSSSRGAGQRPPSTVRFEPGAIIAGRYRLVALLGKGGMGEVYRADDLTLDQPVALKFLPEGVANSPDRLAQFHGELRTARQVSHKNVCRLYDLGEADGRPFITMEYVDGEDLASLLRRIGRVPEDKAVELARQLCAGLAASHDKGVLHRDLKPANVMIDGDGNVRLTDFGLAAAEGQADAVRAGTPQYMAPEQLAGQPASVRSDVYALGLVLFEIFTGRRAYDAKSLQDLRALQESGTLTTPSSVVRDLDPAIERAILRCLERDPQRRPGSALAVAAALPGGDPVAAALAAGETPSPEMLVAAGEAERVAPRRARYGAGVVFLAALAAFVVLSSGAAMTSLVPLDKPTGCPRRSRAADHRRARLRRRRRPTARTDSRRRPTIPTWAVAHERATELVAGARVGRAAGAHLLVPRQPARSREPARQRRHRADRSAGATSRACAASSWTRAGRLQEFHAVPPQFDASSDARAGAGLEGALRRGRTGSVGVHAGRPRVDAARLRRHARGLGRARSPAAPTSASAWKRRRTADVPSSFSIVGPWTRPSA